MKSRTALHTALAISIALFIYLVCTWTILPSEGTIEFQGEGVYVGELKGRTFQGQGTWTSVLGPVYEGEFKDGVFHGQGTMTFANGAKYIGEFKDGYMHGHGKMVFPDGHVHEGIWDADEFQGDHADCGHDH